MRGKYVAKRAILEMTRAAGLTALSRYVTRHGFNVIGFHGVSLEDEHQRFPTLFISPESFERRLRFLARHYRIVPLEEAVEQHRRGRIRPNQVVLTFDDGFYNFLARAVPILKKYQAHATVYVVSSEVESRQPTHNLLVRDLILSTTLRDASGLPHAPGQRCDLTTQAKRNQVIGDALSALERLVDDSERLAYCRSLGTAVAVDCDAKLQARLWDRLNSDEVTQVAHEGFGVQLHTHSHRNVIANRAEVREQVRINRAVLEPLSGRPAVHFCYPLGLWDKDVWHDLLQEGVESAVTTRNGPNFPQTPLLALRRYLTGEQMTDLEFEFALSGARWLAHALIRPAAKFEASEKRVRYQDQPVLY